MTSHFSSGCCCVLQVRRFDSAASPPAVRRLLLWLVSTLCRCCGTPCPTVMTSLKRCWSRGRSPRTQCPDWLRDIDPSDWFRQIIRDLSFSQAAAPQLWFSHTQNSNQYYFWNEEVSSHYVFKSGVYDKLSRSHQKTSRSAQVQVNKGGECVWYIDLLTCKTPDSNSLNTPRLLSCHFTACYDSLLHFNELFLWKAAFE